MKKILSIALICLLIFSASGCGLVNKKAEHSDDPVTDERKEYDGAMIKYISNTDTSLTVTIENNTDSVWQSGNMRDYKLEVERDGQWYEVVQIGELANTMELMIFAPGETLTHTFLFSERYGDLAPGKYRVVKSWWANASETREAGEFCLSCEFTVD